MNIYSKIFNGRTKTVQVINLMLLGIWIIDLVMVCLGLDTDLTDRPIPYLVFINITGFILGLGAYTCKEQNCERCLGLRSASLLLGGIFHALTASTYIQGYPPFKVGTLSEVVFALIFFMSGVYALTKEGEYGNKSDSKSRFV